MKWYETLSWSLVVFAYLLLIVGIIKKYVLG